MTFGLACLERGRLRWLVLTNSFFSLIISTQVGSMALCLEDLLSSAEGSRNTSLTQAPLSWVFLFFDFGSATLVCVCMCACVHGHFVIRGWQSLFLVTAGVHSWWAGRRWSEVQQCLGSRRSHQALGTTQHFLTSPHLIQSDRWKMCSQVFCSKWLRRKKFCLEKR